MKYLVSWAGIVSVLALFVLGVNRTEIRLGPGMVLLALTCVMAGLGLLKNRTASLSVGMWLLLLAGGYFWWRTLGSGPLSLQATDQVFIPLTVLSILILGVCIGDNGRAQRWALYVLGFFLVCQFGAASWQKWGDPGFSFFETKKSAEAQMTGLMTHHNYFAALMVGLASYAMAGAMLLRSAKLKILCGLSVVACVCAIAWSQSRGGSIALAVALALAVVVSFLIRHFQRDRDAGKIALLGLAGVLLVLVAGGFYVSYLEEGRGKDLLGGGIRPALFQLATNLFLEKPVTGHGPMAFSYLSAQQWSAADNGWVMAMPEFAHNEYLQVLVDYGLIGLILIVVVLGAALIKSLLVILQGLVSSDEHAVLIAGALAGLVGFLTQSIFSFVAHIPSTLMMVVFHLGVLLAWRREGKPTGWTTVTSVTMALVFFAGAGWLGLKGYDFTRVWIALEQAKDRKLEKGLVEAFYQAGEVSQQAKYFVEGAAVALTAKQRVSGNEEKEKWSQLALKGYHKAYELNPEVPEAASGYAVTLDAAGKFEEARSWHELARSKSPNLAPKLGYEQAFVRHLYLGAFKKMSLDATEAERDLRLAFQQLYWRRHVGETPESYESRVSMRAFALKWISYLEGRRLYLEGDRVWKSRQAERGLALMETALVRYKSSLQAMTTFDSRFKPEWDQLNKNIKLLRGANITSAKLTPEEIEVVALGPFKDGLATGEGKR